VTGRINADISFPGDFAVNRQNNISKLCVWIMTLLPTVPVAAACGNRASNTATPISTAILIPAWTDWTKAQTSLCLYDNAVIQPAP
jgi:hypothetical protein